jgi:hypothetical protein
LDWLYLYAGVVRTATRVETRLPTTSETGTGLVKLEALFTNAANEGELRDLAQQLLRLFYLTF